MMIITIYNRYIYDDNNNNIIDIFMMIIIITNYNRYIYDNNNKNK